MGQLHKSFRGALTNRKLSGASVLNAKGLFWRQLTLCSLFLVNSFSLGTFGNTSHDISYGTIVINRTLTFVAGNIFVCIQWDFRKWWRDNISNISRSGSMCLWLDTHLLHVFGSKILSVYC